MRVAFRKPLILRAAALVIALLMAAGPWLKVGQYALAATAEPVKMRIEIADNGFKGISGNFSGDSENFTINVEQGQVVELTFVFAQTIETADEHSIVLKGYGLETDNINYYNREATLKFVADKVGNFDLICDLDCKIHDLLKAGQLKVKPSAGSESSSSASSSGSASSAVAATSLSLTNSVSAVAGGPVTLTASLKDPKGAPVSKAEVGFYVETEFVGTKGLMEVGLAKTDKDGVARVEYAPAVAGEQRVVARFEGMGLYGESEQSFPLSVKDASPAYAVEPPALEGLRDWAPLGVVAILLSVWSTFAYVLYNVYRIGRAPN